MSEIKAADPTLSVAWHISSYSVNGSGQCIEAGPHLCGPPRFAVRDSIQRDLGFLSFPSSEWSAFVTGVKTGEH